MIIFDRKWEYAKLRLYMAFVGTEIWFKTCPFLNLYFTPPETNSENTWKWIFGVRLFPQKGLRPIFGGLLLLVSGRVLPRYIWIKVSPIRDPYKPTIVECKPRILLATYLASEPRSRRWTVASTPWHVLEKLIVKQIRRYQVYTPWKLTWNLKMMVSNRNLLFQGFIFRFHVSFPGCKPRINGLMING